MERRTTRSTVAALSTFDMTPQSTPSGVHDDASSASASTNDIVINQSIFATASDIKKSLDVAHSDIEIHVVADRLEKIAKVTALYKLTPQVYTTWCRDVRKHVSMTGTSAAFLPEDGDCNPVIALWQAHWARKLKDVAPHGIQYNTNATPLELLTLFTKFTSAKTENSKDKIVVEFMGLKPKENLAALLQEIDLRLTRFTPHFQLLPRDNLTLCYQILVCHCIKSHSVELALQCADKTLDETLHILRQYVERFSTSSTKECTYCNKRGHTVSECQRKSTKSSKQCSYCNKRGHTVDECRKKASEKAGVKAIQRTQPKDAEYVLDTAADEHTAFNKTDFSSYKQCTRTAELADGSTTNIIGEGVLRIPSLLGEPLLLRNAIHLNGSGPTLLSLAQLLNDGYRLQVPETMRELNIMRNGKVVLTFTRQANRFVWYPSLQTSSPSQLTTANTWHAALGHIGPRALKRTLQDHTSVAGTTPTTKNCSACAQAKFTKSPGHSKLIHEATRFLDVLHMDLVGGKDALPPSTGPSDVAAATMALTIIDEFTRFKWVIPLYAKSDAHIQLKGLLLQLRSQFERQPFRIHSDRGSEFIGEKLSYFLIEHGIKWTGSAAHAHEQNGLIERTNRTIFEALRASHIHANLPSKVWSTTILALVHTLNQTATTSTNISPFELAYGKKPKLVAEPLGSRVIFRKDEKATLSKLDPRTAEGVFLGCIHGVATILDLNTKRLVTRRDYTIFPTEFPLRPRLSSISSPSITVGQALSSPSRNEWYQAMHKEVNTMMEMGVWTLVPKSSLPKDTNIMTGTWALRTKPNGEKKARWCARGFSEPNVDAVYADVLQAVSMRLFFAYAAQNNYPVHHVDVNSAFLNAKLDKALYLHQPYHIPRVPGMVCLLRKSIYGLRTAPRRWQEDLHKSLVSKGWTRLVSDRSLYRKGRVLMSVYVDDFKITGPDDQISSAIQDLQSSYKVKDLGPISHYLGMEIQRGSDGSYKLSQMAKVDALINLLELQSARPIAVPVPDDNRIDREPQDLLDGDTAKLYRSAVGQLLHISLYTRPDLAYAVMRLTQRFAHPTKNSFHALKAVGKYLLHTSTLGLHYARSQSTVLGSSDSSWGTITQARATTGNIFMLNGCPIAWKAKRQTLTAQSTCEAEYVAASAAATQASWLLPLFIEIWNDGRNHGPIILQMDNQAAISTARADNLTARNRHFLIRQSVLREALANRVVDIRYTPSQEMVADGLTKGLQRQKHEHFLSLTGLQSCK